MSQCLHLGPHPRPPHLGSPRGQREECWPGMGQDPGLGVTGGEDAQMQGGALRSRLVLRLERGSPGVSLFLQPGHATGSWALQTPGSTTWRSQMPSCLMTLLTSARPRRPPCVPGGQNSPCSVMTRAFACLLACQPLPFLFPLTLPISLSPSWFHD